MFHFRSKPSPPPAVGLVTPGQAVDSTATRRAFGELECTASFTSLRNGLRGFVRYLGEVYAREKPLHELDFEPLGFEWLDFHDSENSVICFVRKSSDGGLLVAVFNMTSVPRLGYRIGVPAAGRYAEILNSDATEYGGSGVGNLGGVDSEPVAMHGRPHSIVLTLPPLAALFLKLERGGS